MKLFNISQSESRMVLAHQRAPQLVRLAWSAVAILFFGFILLDMLDKGRDALFGIVAFGCFFLYYLFQAGRQLLRMTQGNVWVFDLENNQVTRDQKLVANLKHIQFIRVWEDAEGEGPLTRHLALVDASNKDIAVSDAISAREWKHLVEAAEKISAFTGIELLRG